MDAFTTISGTFTQPAVSSNTASLTVGNSSWMTVGQAVFVQTGGYYTVASKADTTHVVLTNLGYAGNTAPASTGNGGNVSPGGVIGATGPSFSLIGGMGETTKYLRAVGSKTYVGMHNNLDAVTAANEANVQSAIPVAGKVTRLTVQIVTTAGVPTAVGGTAGTTIMRFTVRKSTGGGAFTSEAVTCDAGSTATGCTASSSLSASFAAGDPDHHRSVFGWDNARDR